MNYETKETYIDCIGKIPSDWIVKPLKFLVREPITDGPHETPDFVENGVIFLSVDGIQNNRLVFENTRFISEIDARRYDLKVKPEFNDILLGKAASIGKVAIVDKNIRFQVWSPLAVIKTNKQIEPLFLKYYLMSPSGQKLINDKATENTQKNIAMEDIERLKIVLPSLEEQQKIACFLNVKCESIDKLISTTEEQIDELRKFRISVIDEILTKGFNNDFICTNNRWFKEVPKKWKVKKIKYVLEDKAGIKVGPFGSSLSDKIVYDNGDIRVYGQWNVIAQNFNMDRNFINNEDFTSLMNYEVLPGDVLISMMGTIGRCIEVPNDIQKGIMDSHIIKVRLNDLMNVEYFCYFYDKTYSSCIFRQLEFEKNGSIMDGLNSTIVKNLTILVPPIEEQMEIVKHIKEKLNTIDKLISKKQEEISLLSEYKDSLLYEYTTGKKRLEVM